jgi:hypothetical protein
MGNCRWQVGVITGDSTEALPNLLNAPDRIAALEAELIRLSRVTPLDANRVVEVRQELDRICESC